MEKIQIEEKIPKQKIAKDRRMAFFIVLNIVLSIITIWYTIKNRSSNEILKFSSYISISAGILFVTLIFLNWVLNGIKKPTKSELIFSLSIFLVVIPVIGITYYSFAASINDTFLWLKSPSVSKFGAVSISIVSTLLIGLSLFYFRLKYRSLYGMTEAVVGLTVAANKVLSEYDSNSFTSGFFLAILTAAVYLVVRGLDNIHQGLTKEPKDAFVLKFLQLKK